MRNLFTIHGKINSSFFFPYSSDVEKESGEKSKEESKKRKSRSPSPLIEIPCSFTDPASSALSILEK